MRNKYSNQTFVEYDKIENQKHEHEFKSKQVYVLAILKSFDETKMMILAEDVCENIRTNEHTITVFSGNIADNRSGMLVHTNDFDDFIKQVDDVLTKKNLDYELVPVSDMDWNDRRNNLCRNAYNYQKLTA